MKLILSFLCLGVFCLTSSVFAQNPSSFPTSEDAISGVQEDTLDEEIQNSNISYKVIGISGDLRDNVDAYLSTLPDIKKVNFYSQQENIEQKINTALAVFGYYHVKTHYQFASEKSTTLIINVDAGKPVWIRKVDVVVLGEAMTDPRYMFMFRKLTLKSHTIFKHSVYGVL